MRWAGTRGTSIAPRRRGLPPIPPVTVAAAAAASARRSAGWAVRCDEPGAPLRSARASESRAGKLAAAI